MRIPGRTRDDADGPRSRFIRRLFAAAVLALGLGGCGDTPRPASQADAPEPKPSSSCQRIVALAPSSVEIAFALGLGPRVVGVGDYCTYPPEIDSLPRLGGLVDPNLEAIVALSPDLAVVLPSESKLAGQLARVGIDTLEVDSDSLADVEAAIAAVARRCAAEEAGHELLARFRAGLAPVERPSGAKVLLSLEREPGKIEEVLSAGLRSSYGELLARLGAANVFADAAVPFPKVGLESVLGRAPEVILELQAEAPTPELARLLAADWRRFPELPAVAAGRIAVIGGSHTLVPGPRLVQLYDEMKRALGEDGSPR